MYNTIDCKIRGVVPILLHNGQLADPLNKWVRAMKEVTSKRTKTDDDYAKLVYYEFMGGLYVNANRRVVIPGLNIEATLLNAAKKQKRGPAFKAGVIVESDYLLDYDGPDDPEVLFKDKRFVDTRRVKINGKASVQRTRPIFSNWALSFTVSYLPNVVNVGSIREAITTAGTMVGLCDYSPRFGRFEVVKFGNDNK